MHLISQKGVSVSDAIPLDSTELTVSKKEGERRIIALDGNERQGYSSPWAMPSFADFSRLTTLTLSCPLAEMPSLPLSLKKLTLHRSHLGDMQIASLGDVQEFALTQCSGRFRISLSAEAPLKKLTVAYASLEQGGVQDDCFVSFPSNLAIAVFRGLAITDATIKRLPLTLGTLNLKECPKVTASKDRLEAIFDSCIFKVELHKSSEESQAAACLRKLSERVRGQEEAVQRTYERIVALLQGGQNERKRPAAILLFVGPTGVGKTELAEAISETTGRPLARFDMTSYKEGFQVTRLIGSPPGYVGSSQGGALTNAVIQDPRAVILFDELEKAHCDVIQALLGLFDKGIMTTSSGESVDFTQTIVVMTSNLASREIADLDWRNPGRASEAAKRLVSERLRETVSPEFVGRIDEIIAFRPINREFLREILAMNAEKIVAGAATKYGITLTIDPAVIDHLIESADPATGVRAPLKRLQDQADSILREGQINSVFFNGEKVRIALIDGKIKLRVTT